MLKTLLSDFRIQIHPGSKSSGLTVPKLIYRLVQIQIRILVNNWSLTRFNFMVKQSVQDHVIIGTGSGSYYVLYT